MTAGQARARQELWPRFGIEITGKTLQLDDLFGRTADKVLEIGFGNGESLVQLAQNNPQLDFLGVEVHEPGIGHCMMSAQAAGLSNLRIVAGDALEALKLLPDDCLSRVNLLFPDPWPKKRHHKRRIVQAAFLELIARKLCNGGDFYIATDWENYALHIDAVIAAAPQFRVRERCRHAGDRALARPQTKFELRGLTRGHGIVDWHLVRV
jgi:tRNA (guanine-N7-)-methyltransferase